MSIAITFEVNNQRKMQLVQHQHDGDTHILTLDAYGEPEYTKEATVITPGDFVMLINYFRFCKRSGKPVFAVSNIPGKWISGKCGIFYCSRCGYVWPEPGNISEYCPGCGTWMEIEETGDL